MDKQLACCAGGCPGPEVHLCTLPLASPCTLAAPVVAEQQPLQRQGQGRWAAASGVLPIWRLILLLLLTLSAPGLRWVSILSSAIATCLGAGGNASGESLKSSFATMPAACATSVEVLSVPHTAPKPASYVAGCSGSLSQHSGAAALHREQR